jgi:hypothetical protein
VLSVEQRQLLPLIRHTESSQAWPLQLLMAVLVIMILPSSRDGQSSWCLQPIVLYQQWLPSSTLHPHLRRRAVKLLSPTLVLLQFALQLVLPLHTHQTVYHYRVRSSNKNVKLGPNVTATHTITVPGRSEQWHIAYYR